jgi:hypothetical protein
MENNNQRNIKPTPQINLNANTPVVFTLKTFLGTIGSILSLFIGFYYLAINPRLTKSEEFQKTLYVEQKTYITSEFKNVNKTIEGNSKAIGLNTSAISATNDRFFDLNESVKNLPNSGGSFGDVSEKTSTDDNSLVSID